jgi:hypothetical protein
VEVAAGAYTIDAQLDMPADVTLRGAGAPVTILEASGMFNLIFPGENSGFTIEGFTMIPHSERTAVNCYSGSGVIDANVFLGPGDGTTCGGTITNNVFAGNAIGVYAHGKSPTIANNVFAECDMGVRLHFAITTGGHRDANPRIFNNVFVSNTEAIHNHRGSPDNDYTRSPAYNLLFNNGADCDGCTMGTPNLTEDPVFVAYTANDDFTDDDFHIVADTSPCVEAGTLSHEDADAPVTDVDGETRPMGAAPEIGVDEVEGPPVADEEPETVDAVTDAVDDAPADMAADLPSDPGTEPEPEGGEGGGCGCSLVT